MMSYKSSILLLILGLLCMSPAAFSQEERCSRENVKRDLAKDNTDLTENSIRIGMATCLEAQRSARRLISQQKFLIDSSYITSECTEESLVNALNGQDISSMDRSTASIKLRRAICLTAQSKILGTELRQLGRREASEVDEIVSALQEAQTLGLKGLAHSFAQLLEGVLSGIKAQALLGIFNAAPQTNNIEERINFCYARQGAALALGSLDWRGISFEFKTGHPTVDVINISIPRRIGELYADTNALASSLGSICLEMLPVRADEIEAALEKALNQSVGGYFASTSPLTGMLQRKLARVKKPAEFYEVRQRALTTEAQEQSATVDSLNQIVQQLKGPSDQVLEDYEAAYTSVRALSDWMEGFRKGLFLAPNGESTLLVLRTAYDKVFDPVCGSLSGTFGNPSGGMCNIDGEIKKENYLGSFEQNLRNFKQKLETIMAGEASYTAATKALCAIYFCQVRADKQLYKAMTATNGAYCKKTIDPDTRGRMPLCALSSNGAPRFHEPGKVPGSSDMTVYQLCSAVNFPEKYMQADLGESSKEQCLNWLKNPESNLN